MKINNYSATLDEKMSEFDMWVTPSLGEIRDTPQFRTNLEQLKKGFDYMADITKNFADVSHCSSFALATNVLTYLSDKDDGTAKDILDSICNVLLLATGKTDNNLKCQFPLMLRNQIGISTYPQKMNGGRWKDKDIPRAFSMTDVTKTIVQLTGQDDYRRIFVESYFHLIVSDEDYAKQLWSLGNAYVSQKEVGTADALISSIVIFQSRGSITATQGHIPETILRSYMADWGLRAGTDFNTQDVEVGEILGDLPVDKKLKKRKYDFIVPFQSRKSGAKVFIQSQFYAGDSGSVSHKVVDQTDSTREVTLKKYPDAVFIEYLDGAGYFSSLNGDLRKMLAKPTTKDFIQIRTAPLKLRRALQGIMFLTPLEIEHAVIRTSGKEDEIYQLLRDEGYIDEEIRRALSASVTENNIVAYGEHCYKISPDRVEIVRKYCLLDIIANYGAPVSIGNEPGCLFVAGFETSWGLPQNETIKIAQEVFPGLGELWSNVQDAFDDIQWLINKGFVITK